MEQPLFQVCKGGGRGQKALYVSHAPGGVVLVELTRDVGPDAVSLLHPLQRAEVVDLCKALQTWLDAPESHANSEP